MPFKRTRPFKKKVMRKLYRRRGYTMRKYKTDPRSMIGFPKQRVVKMRWMENVTLDSPGGPITRVYSANDINNVFALPVHRPLGYDEWATFYQEWTVIGSRIRVTATFAGNQQAIPINWGIILSTEQSIPFTQVSAFVEQGKTKFKIMQPAVNGNMTRNTLSYSAKKFFNIANVKDNKRILGSYFAPGLVVPPPELVSFYNIWVAAADNSSNVEPINITTTIEYLVLCGGQRPLAQSAIPSGP